jgi:ribosomal protein L32
MISPEREMHIYEVCPRKGLAIRGPAERRTPRRPRKILTVMVCSACGTGYDSPATSCPRCGTPAGSVTRRVGSFALACLQIARIATLVGGLTVLAAGGVAAWNAHYFLAALLVLLGVPVSVGHFVAFRLAIEYART